MYAEPSPTHRGKNDRPPASIAAGLHARLARKLLGERDTLTALAIGAATLGLTFAILSAVVIRYQVVAGFFV